MAVESALPEGLRARKKLRTRTEISDVATRLFAERGFEAVTLADIAQAAEVSVKTIFNHFGGKEELYFDREDEVREALIRAIATSAPGRSPLDGLRHLLVDNMVPLPGRTWEAFDEEPGLERFRTFLAVEEGSPALRARRLVIGVQLGDAVTVALAEQLGRSAGDDAVRILSTFVAGVLQLRDAALRRGVLAGAPLDEIRAGVTAVVEQAFDRLERAFSDLQAGEAGRALAGPAPTAPSG